MSARYPQTSKPLSTPQLSLPDDVVWTSDPEALLVVDFGNNRVLRFVPPP